MSRTRLALWLYYLAISFLTICAIVIVVKLIVFPPCTLRGNTCVVDPWSAAGLESAVLGVSATVLAILGAVAVAGWWTSLNERVKDQVNVLYNAQKAEVHQQLDDYVVKQKQEINDQLGTIQANVQSVEGRIGNATAEIDELEKLTYDFLDIAIDGIVLALPGSLETWAQKATALHKFPRVPLKMAERYLSAVVDGLTGAEQDMLRARDNYAELYEDFHRKRELYGDPKGYTESVRADCYHWLEKDDTHVSPAGDILNCWEGVLRWQSVAESEKVDHEALQELDRKIAAHRARMDQLKLLHDGVKEQVQRIIDLTTPFSQVANAEQNTARKP